MGKDRARRGDAKASAAPSAPAGPQQLLSEASTLQQRAERRRGQEAVAAYEQAVAAYRAALAQGLPAQDQPDALFGAAECLQMWADTLLDIAAKLPDEQLTLDAEQQASSAACELFRQAAEAYQQVRDADGSNRVDALVNAGNTLTAWAQQAQQQALQLCEQAVQAYQAAITKEEDALTWSNLADALVQQAELLCSAGGRAEGEAMFSRALQAYEHSCALSDSSNGDDLPGLLYNWGVGLQAVSKHAQEPAARAALLEQARQKLQASLEFDRADTAPCNALGEVLVAMSELAGQEPAEVAALLQRAVSEGYMLALNISRNDTDALVGYAEANAELARLARRHGGDGAQVSEHLQQALGAYNNALRQSSKLGRLEDRCDVRYNCACVHALLGAEQEAARLLQQVAAAGMLVAAEVAADEDLAGLRDRPWLQQLLQAAK